MQSSRTADHDDERNDVVMALIEGSLDAGDTSIQRWHLNRVVQLWRGRRTPRWAIVDGEPLSIN